MTTRIGTEAIIVNSVTGPGGPGNLVPPGGLLEDCVRLAVMAPSLHNSQPWLFRVLDGEVEVFADPNRRLDVLDPFGREQTISVGAALFTLRLALCAAGYRPAVQLFPAPERPDLVARVTVAGTSPATADVARLVAAVPRRHTNRYPFISKAVPADVIEQLVVAAAQEGAGLAITGQAARNTLSALSRVAERRQHATGHYRAELTRWSTGRDRRGDGIPSSALGPGAALASMPIRDFGLLQPNLLRPAEAFEPYPSILVLSTSGDDRNDWAAAGQALQRVLLTATVLGLATTPISQLVEVPAIREQLADTDAGVWAQLILRVGYGQPAAATPRRPLADVILPG